jgi:hydroxyethylthiazole kinase
MPWRDIERIRKQAPLIHNITNYVVMNTTANALLALGASPVMAHAVEEVEEMASIASALVLNIGTLSAAWIEAMARAGRIARDRGIPVVLDPVGSGATHYRTETAQRLIEETRPTIIRGNASEIRSLAGETGATKGVDSAHDATNSVDAARNLSARANCVVSMSGPVDIIVGAGGELRVQNGHSMMPRVTGMGCTASALTGAFAAVNREALHAAAHAMAVIGIAGEIAGERAQGPGSFQMLLLDALYSLDARTVESRLRYDAVGSVANDEK